MLNLSGILGFFGSEELVSGYSPGVGWVRAVTIRRRTNEMESLDMVKSNRVLLERKEPVYSDKKYKIFRNSSE
jgi:hypothetical protein